MGTHLWINAPHGVFVNTTRATPCVSQERIPKFDQVATFFFFFWGGANSLSNGGMYRLYQFIHGLSPLAMHVAVLRGLQTDTLPGKKHNGALSREVHITRLSTEANLQWGSMTFPLVVNGRNRKGSYGTSEWESSMVDA